MKYLNVAQKDVAAKTIADLLSNGAAQQRDGLSDYNKIYEFDANVEGEYSRMIMTSVTGHLMNYAFELKYRFWKGSDPEELFDAPLEKKLISDNDRRISETLEREIKGCQGLILWTNCNREGENIAFEIINVCQAIEPNIIVKRAIFSDITRASLQHSLDGLIKPNENQSEAVNVRMQIDLRTGAVFTRYQSLRYEEIFPNIFKTRQTIPYGNCTLPTLGFVVKHFKEVEQYIPQTFWNIKVLHTVDDLSVEFIWSRGFDRLLCESFFVSCQQYTRAVVKNIKENQENKERPFPLNTVELEKLGTRILRIAAVDVMQIAENLFNKGVISYPKTEANIFPKDLNLEYLVGIHTTDPNWGSFASKVLEWGVQPNNGTSTDPIHPPIHPKIYTNNLRDSEKQVYDLIVRHFLACVSRNAQVITTTVNINIFNEEFTATGLCIQEKNYLEVYPSNRWEPKKLHNYEIDKQFTPTEILMPEGTTILPKMLTEPDLISLMAANRIGTDGTYIGHINKIKTLGYAIEIENKYLLPTSLGIGLVEGYDAIEVPFAHPELRAELEADLTDICNGRVNPVEILKDQIETYKDFYYTVKENVKVIDKTLAIRLNLTPNYPADLEDLK